MLKAKGVNVAEFQLRQSLQGKQLQCAGLAGQALTFSSQACCNKNRA